jgi:putative ATPase
MPPEARAAGGAEDFAPLADRMRPRALEELAGQEHLLGEGKPLRRMLEQRQAHSMVLWGPPGTGKTTLARIVAANVEAQLLALSAVMSGVKDIREAVAAARAHREATGHGTVLFVDEVHRFNKSQQDAFLPYVEDGTVVFIGATTENPSFALNSALLSRARVYVLKPLDAEALGRVLERAAARIAEGEGMRLAPEARDLLAEAADGDARRGLNFLDLAVQLAAAAGAGQVDADLAREVVADGGLRRFDKGGDAFYDQISALHKSVRGSAPDAALYWLARMLDGGADPLYLARRLVRMASEEVGNADPRALALALDAAEAYERLGSPEGELALAQAAVYLAVAPKSNAVYTAFNQAMEHVRRSGSAEVPLHLRNAPTRLMKGLGYGRAYRCAHDEPEGYAAGEEYFPAELAGTRYYHPVERGMEIRIREKLARLRELDARHGGARGAGQE